MLDVIEIHSAFRGWLISNPDGLGISEKQRQAKLGIRELVGNAIFASRRPANGNRYQTKSGGSIELAITLQKTSADREYPLIGESEYVGGGVNLTVYARNNMRAGVWGWRLTQFIRIATSHYQGDWSYRNDEGRLIKAEIDAATITSESELPPIADTKDATRWEYRYSTNWLVTYKQTAGILQPINQSSGSLIPPPPPPAPQTGVGYDRIGTTTVR